MIAKFKEFRIEPAKIMQPLRKENEPHYYTRCSKTPLVYYQQAIDGNFTGQNSSIKPKITKEYPARPKAP